MNDVVTIAAPPVITTEFALYRAMVYLSAFPIIALDTETTGLDPLTARVRLVQLHAGNRKRAIRAQNCTSKRFSQATQNHQCTR